MTDLELSRLLSDLEEGASKLNAESDSVNKILESVESRLIAMNIGLETWLEEDEALATREESENFGEDYQGNVIWRTVTYRTELGFAKVNDWCLAVRVERGEADPQKPGYNTWSHLSGPTRLADTSRQTRIAALNLLPALLQAVHGKVKSALVAIEGAKKLVK